MNHAINAAFEGLLKEGAHASYFLNLSVDPQSIDINIHPTKTELKFDDEQTIYAILRAAVKHSLGQFSIAPVLDFERDSNLDTPYAYKDKEAQTPGIEVDRSFNPFQEGLSYSSKQLRLDKKVSESWEGLYVGLESKGTLSNTGTQEVPFEGEELRTSIFTEGLESENEHSTFQFHNKFVLSKIKSGMLVIDQSRAHQRILYEGFLENITIKQGNSQQLLFPITLNYSSQDIAIISEVKEDLQNTGFVFGKIDNEQVEIIGTPVHVEENQISDIFDQLISDVENEVPDSHFSITDLLAKSLSKSLAIKSGQTLNAQERDHLVNKLFGCKEPNVSPMGKPTFITLGLDDIERKFN